MPRRTSRWSKICCAATSPLTRLLKTPTAPLSTRTAASKIFSSASCATSPPPSPKTRYACCASRVLPRATRISVSVSPTKPWRSCAKWPTLANWRTWRLSASGKRRKAHSAPVIHRFSSRRYATAARWRCCSRKLTRCLAFQPRRNGTRKLIPACIRWWPYRWPRCWARTLTFVLPRCATT